MSIRSYLVRTRVGTTLARLGRDSGGATIVEFAFVVGPLMALLVASAQVSLTFFAQQTLETTAEKATRQLLTGAAQNSNMSKTQFKELVCSKLPAFMKCANVIVDVQAASNFASATTGVPTLTYDSNGNISNNWAYQPGAAGQITVARIMYVWNVRQGPLGFDLSTMSSGKRLLMSTSVFKTEPYA